MVNIIQKLFRSNLLFKIIPNNKIVYNICKRYINSFRGENNDNMNKNGELRILKKNLKDFHIIFDVGANIGEWTDQALKIKKDLEIHCFEPSSFTFNKIKERNFPSSVIINNFGLSSKQGEKILNIFKDGAGINALYSREGLEERFKKIKKELVKLDTLKNYCEIHQIDKIDYIKIDTEGHEYDVLKGGIELFEKEKVKMIQFEYGGTYVDAHILLKDIFILFKNFNYRFYLILPKSIKYIKKYDIDLENFVYKNFLIVNKNYRIKS